MANPNVFIHINEINPFEDRNIVRIHFAWISSEKKGGRSEIIEMPLNTFDESQILPTIKAFLGVKSGKSYDFITQTGKL